MFIYSGKLLHTSKKFLSTFTYHPLFLFVSRQKFEATFQGKSLKVKVEENGYRHFSDKFFSSHQKFQENIF